MDRSLLASRDISALTASLTIMLHAGVGPADAMTLLAQDEERPDLKALYNGMARRLDEGSPLSGVMEDCGRFPLHVSALVGVGERTGRSEEALRSLSRHYEDRDRMERHVRSALTYPVILLILMLVVIVVLLSQVLPVFESVYASLGGQLTGVAGGLLVLGKWLGSALPVLCVLLGAVLLFLAAFSLHTDFRARVLALWRKISGERGLTRKMNDARFAQALSMCLASGLPLEEAVDLAASLLSDVPPAAARYEKCRALLAEGIPLAKALEETGMLPASSCRLLEVGVRGGSGDAAMERIAQTLSEDAELSLEETVARVEPTLVIVTSLLVGSILLSVMLPLMNIMSAIG